MLLHQPQLLALQHQGEVVVAVTRNRKSTFEFVESLFVACATFRSGYDAWGLCCQDCSLKDKGGRLLHLKIITRLF